MPTAGINRCVPVSQHGVSLETTQVAEQSEPKWAFRIVSLAPPQFVTWTLPGVVAVHTKNASASSTPYTDPQTRLLPPSKPLVVADVVSYPNDPRPAMGSGTEQSSPPCAAALEVRTTQVVMAATKAREGRILIPMAGGLER